KDEVTGMSSGKPFDKLGFRASETSEVYFEDARIPEKSLIGKEADGWNILVQAGGGMRAWAAASMALGNAEGALEYAIKYARERITFGKPLIQHQVIQFMIADMGIQIEAARSLHYRTLRMLDSGKYSSAEHQILTSATKCYCTDIAMKITTDAAQILGSYGVMNEYPMGRRMRDAKVNQIFDGATEIQKMIVGRLLAS
ncbi:MAG: acyl-CoA dehydrogenase family protein, partial [Thermodesulfobacteriota bacterium]|nr:acyl-CoA dehydrogenase family protein [Thermodesulfobacteriota bacterium]